MVQRGFTLLELLIVLVLIGLITGIVVPRLGGSLNSSQLKSSVNHVAAIFRYARTLAVTNQQTQVARCYLEQNRILLEPVPAEDDEIKASALQQKPTRSQSYQLPDGIRIEKALDRQEQESTELFQIFFYPEGNSSGGDIFLMGKGKARYQIRVDFITGLVHVL